MVLSREVRSDRDAVKRMVDKETGKPIAGTELIRLSKMTQEERDREHCEQRAFKPDRRGGRSLFDEIEPEIENPRLKDSITVNFYRETFDFCKRLRQEKR